MSSNLAAPTNYSSELAACWKPLESDMSTRMSTQASKERFPITFVGHPSSSIIWAEPGVLHVSQVLAFCHGALSKTAVVDSSEKEFLTA